MFSYCGWEMFTFPSGGILAVHLSVSYFSAAVVAYDMEKADCPSTYVLLPWLGDVYFMQQWKGILTVHLSVGYFTSSVIAHDTEKTECPPTYDCM